MSPSRLLLATLVAVVCLSSTAPASQSTSLHATFTPEHLGKRTTVNFTVRIAAPAGQVPSPMTAFEVTYPRALGLAVGGLGLDTCSQARLEATGGEGCPADSRMGQGSALAEIPIGPEIIRETATVAIFRAPEQEGHLALLFYATGISPVFAQIAFPGLLLRGPGHSDDSIHIEVPLVPSLPGAPDVAVVELHATFGPRNLIYYERIHGRLLAYRPEGILLPHRCPAGGFLFTGAFGFLDGSSASAKASVPCPLRRPQKSPEGSSPRTF